MMIEQLVAFYFSATIGINILCASVLLSSGLRKEQSLFKSLFVACILSILYQYATWAYHHALSIESALMWLRFQTSIVILSLPLFCMVFVTWSRQRLPKGLLWSLWLISFAFFVANSLSSDTLRFSGGVELLQYTLFNGETVSRLIGERTYGILLFQLYALGILFVLMFIAANLIKKGKFLLSALLILTLILQVFSAVMSIQVDSGKFNFIYLGGLPFTILNFIACISVASSLERKRKSLRQEVEVRKSLEQVLSGIAKGANNKQDDEFFLHMMQQLQKLCDCKIAYIALFDDIYERISTEVVVHEKRILNNYHYYMNDIPKELFSSHDCLLVNKNLEKAYPEFEFFKLAKARALLNAPLLDKSGKPMGTIVMIFDHEIEDTTTLLQTMDVFRARAAAEIQRNKLESQLHKMAYYDYQTKLPNVTRLHELVAKALTKSEESDSQNALIVFDLNKFNEVNQDYGFESAEYCIKQLGKRLAEYANEDITIARTGGDEFSVLITDIAMLPDGIARLHWDAVSEIVRRPCLSNNSEIKLSACAGAVIFPEQSNKAHEIKRCAEIALSQSKDEHSRELVLFNPKALEENNRRRRIEALLHEAIATDKELFPVYQPKVDGNGKLIGAEVLCRWISAEVGFVPPDEFIAMAEHTGSINKLGFWMVKKVCEHINAWSESGIEIPSRIAINVSAVQLVQENFVSDFLMILEQYGVSPKQIEIELTESGLLVNLDESISKLNALREKGFTIALDDFGTGYSSLSYLKDLPLDVLKIDRSFVNVIEEKRASELARSIITIAHNMSLSVVAEGVEDAKHVSTLSNMGCSIFQGYYFAKPMKAEEFLDWAKNR